MICLVIGTVLAANYMQNKEKERRQKLREAQTSAEETTDNSTLEGYASLAEQYHLDPTKDPYAFLRDDDFFDKEEEKKDPGTQLSLLVSSAERDIYVNIVDGNGDAVKGQRFDVYLTEAGETAAKTEKDAGKKKYTDLDKDGSIYIAELTSGNYTVSLEDVDGYEIAGNDVPVFVKEQLEYTVLKDISYLIKTEDEIDVDKEDTKVCEAEADADGTEHNQKISDDEAVLGIDVSKWNKEIDWEKVKADGVEFAVIRCGYRGSSTGALVEDPYFAKNIEDATKAGLKVGVYFFTQAISEVEAVEEASMVLTLVRSNQITYPLYIDTEGAGGNGRADGLDKEMRSKIVKAFCETIENSGFNAGIYASKNWYENNLDMSSLSGYQNWLAQYSSKPTYEGEYSMWQYTSAGSVDGITGRVDLNLSYMAY
jgi:GH25 family lysozyme M1 (1,4-beta-N-acetylmuramidase)